MQDTPGKNHDRLRVQFFIGTRPECIKLSPLVAELERRHDDFEVSVCLTSQHREMLQQALEWFPIRVDHDLDVMTEGQHLVDLQARILMRSRGVIEDFRPDWVVVQGDTTTALSAAMAATWLQVPVAHVEAGLRTGNRMAPWPEELNRSLIGRMALLHLAPTEANADALRHEAVEGAIDVVGNTVIDALLDIRERLRSNEELRGETEERLQALGLALDARRLMLVTGHRRESFGEGFRQICQALKAIALGHPELHVVYAVHLNPQVHDLVHRELEGLDNVTLLPPLDYAAFVYLMDRSYLILSDSGGVQEEAPSLDRPVLVMRETTERQEAVDAGAVRLVGTGKERIVAAVDELLGDEAQYRRMASARNPFGDGTASAQIAECLLRERHRREPE
ncbi:MAG: UDP-N-acetylglucosamine 2-epimerase (non-hydrolyzing) [Gammaproteobacteria bacterium]|nr:MAG: UDP-N-acetylglucosamine 2-epimerase (non-hydrolyzing) [Gammaproteobacteria bacterium]PIE36513.1 MAG: UDP-N-acetylglucosamine 2-epimerase (non-hydrolyzing) [Gammaproteobacteria bacterium]